MKIRDSFSNTSDNNTRNHHYKQTNDNANSRKEKERDKESERDTDHRLKYVLTVLDISELYSIFISHNISFVDMLLLEKEDMLELQLELYQRNRIWNFSVLYKKYATNYSIEEINDFFSFNRQFIFMKYNIEDINGEEGVGEEQPSQSKNDDDNDEEEGKLNSQSSGRNKEILNMKKAQPQKIFSQKAMNEQKLLPPKQITLSTSKENVHDEVIEERKANETYPNIHQSVLEDYHMTKLLTEGNKQYGMTDIRNKRSQRNNNLMQDKKGLITNNAYRNYASVKQDADDILMRLSKIKEEGEVNKNKYKSLLQKIDKTNSNSNTNGKHRNESAILDLHFNKLIMRINQASEMKMSFDAYEKLNQIKEFVNIKGIQIKLSDIQIVNKELDVLFNSLLTSDDTQSSNNTNSNKIKNNNEEANHGNEIEIDDNVNEVEELEEEYEADECN